MVRLTSGTYYIGQSLKIGDNTHLLMDQDVVLVRKFSNGALNGATIVNKGGTSGNTNIRVSGGRILAATGGTYTGKHIGFDKVKFLEIDGVHLDKTQTGWRLFCRDCQDVRIANLVCGDDLDTEDLLTEDGIHFSGGERIVVTNCTIRSGDDCVSLAHENQSDSKPSMPLVDFALSNCALTSARANIIKIHVESQGTTSYGISRVRISNVVGKCGLALSGDSSSNGIVIQDKTTGARLLTDVALDGVTLDCGQNSTIAGAGYPLIVTRVDRLQLTGVRILQPARDSQINDSNDIELRDCSILNPRLTSINCLTIAGTNDCTNVRILGGLYRGA
ncbi:MAG: hypothetical protein KF688_17970, partial [Pirellulales bacterium]|nr:hypothetical protein [Pirellulales bacterium]